jgi:protein-disulfide isomerase
MLWMRTFLKMGSLGLALTLGVAAWDAAAQDGPFTPTQRDAIGDIVREYILRNPEVIRDAIAELESRTQEAQAQAQAAALRDDKDKIFNSPQDVVAGNPQGDVTLVEFFDFNCGYCKRALADVRELVKRDPKLRVVLKDFPVLGPGSVEAARVALAAKRQLAGPAKQFEFHAKLMELRGPVNGERALGIARDMGLDLARIQKEIQSEDIGAALQENASLGDKLGLTGTPAFVVGEEIIPGAVGLEPLRQAVDNTRRCGKATC